MKLGSMSLGDAEADACNVIFVGTVDRNRQVVVKVGQGEGWCCARRLMLVFAVSLFLKGFTHF